MALVVRLAAFGAGLGTAVTSVNLPTCRCSARSCRSSCACVDSVATMSPVPAAPSPNVCPASPPPTRAAPVGWRRRRARWPWPWAARRGARLLPRLRMATSADTPLRLVRALPLPVAPTSSALGVDDWAFKRGRTYGTLLVDLNTRRAVDLLPDRRADTLAEWLRPHRRIRVVARDRFTEFERGVAMGAPRAIQVADRWHLLQKHSRDAHPLALRGSWSFAPVAFCGGGLSTARERADPCLRARQDRRGSHGGQPGTPVGSVRGSRRRRERGCAAVPARLCCGAVPRIRAILGKGKF